MFGEFGELVRTILREDPAARSALEVVLCYPGFHVTLSHRLAHWLYRSKLYLPARIVSQYARWITGIEIHPGATIGRRVFIDHGMAVVIGETATVGDDVLIYQAVTLGGTGTQPGKRHPTIGNGVVLGAGSKVLGNITVGSGSKIGSGSVVVKSVPENSTVVGIPGKVVRSRDANTDLHEPASLADPQAQSFAKLQSRVTELEGLVRELVEREAAASPRDR